MPERTTQEYEGPGMVGVRVLIYMFRCVMAR